MYTQKVSESPAAMSGKTRKCRGWATYKGDEFSFKPSESGEPAQVNVRTTTGAKTYETTSEKTPLKVAHLTCSANAADPWQEYISQLERLGIKPQTMQQVPEKQRLVNEGGIQVFLDAKQGQLTYQGNINLGQTQNWQSELMHQLQVIVRTLPAHTLFTKTLTSFKKKGGKNETILSTKHQQTH